MTEKYVVKWRCPDDDSRIVYILGLRSDGGFYGDMTIFFPVPSSAGNRGVGTSVEGQLSSAEYSRFCELVGEIQASSPAIDPEGVQCDGYLALATAGPRHMIIKAHYLGRHPDAGSAIFLQLISLFGPSLQERFDYLEQLKKEDHR